MTTVLTDGRVTTDITATVQGSSASACLIVDTGATRTLLPYHKLQIFSSTGPFINYYAAGRKILAMKTYNVAITVDVEPHGRGNSRKVTKSFSSLLVHFLHLPTSPFSQFDGLMGVDALDQLNADAVKDSTGGSAYLAVRV